jgi:signal transduction histidine kinase
MNERIEELTAQLEASTGLADRIDALNALAWALVRSDPERASYLSVEARALASGGDFAARPYVRGRAESRRNVGYANIASGQYDEALLALLEALDLFREGGIPKGQAIALRGIGAIHRELGDYHQALQSLLEALAIGRDTGDRLGEAITLKEVASVYGQLEQYRDALECVEECLRIYRDMGDAANEADALNEAGDIHRNLGDYARAFEFGLRSLELYQEVEDRHGEARARARIGEVHRALGEFENAITYLGQSLESATEAGNHLEEADYLRCIGQVYLDRGEAEKSVSFLLQALALAQQTQAEHLVSEIHGALAEGYKRIGRTEQALTHHEAFYEMKRAQCERESDIRLKALQVTHEVRMAEEQAEICRLRNDVLSGEIREREQIEERLRQYAAELEERNRELDSFAHTVAHDLRDVLNIIVGYADLLESECEGAEAWPHAHEYLEGVARASQKMANVIDELLLLATVRKEQVRVEPLNMDRIVADARRRLMHPAKERKAKFVVPGSWPVAVGYAPWVEEVWVNYMSNAIKYGGDPPRVELGAEKLNDSSVRFWVHDNGAGIDPEEQEKLFVEFSRLADARALGHGLGLSIVRRIMEKLDGTVGIESDGKPGQGTTFSFTLPASPEEG